MSDIPEHDGEPVPGLPERLPAGERVLWQGSPEWLQFAIHALHARKVAIYFAVILAYRMAQGGGLAGHAAYLLLALAGVSLLLALAWFMCRSSLYTITSRRIVMRFGIAIPISINLPFITIDAVKMRRHGSASADFVLESESRPERRLSFFVMWPHLRPWRISVVQPMMRCIADADRVADLLGEMLAGHVESKPAQQRQPLAAKTPPVPSGMREPAFPRPPLIGAAALLSIVIISVAWFRVSSEPGQQVPIENYVASVQLQFEDRDDGAVLVYDATTGALIDELPAGSNNFLRATLRGLVRSRNAQNARQRTAFSLYQIADGRLLLVDPVTGNNVDLWAFGETNARAFAAFLPDAPTQLQVSQAQSSATLVSTDAAAAAGN